MHERMDLIGGSSKVTSSPGGGTRVSLRIPIPTES
jgi:signal transduction histidine kinase